MARSRPTASIAAILAFGPFAAVLHGAENESFRFAPFGLVHVYAPAGPPSAVVLFLSGDGGWNQGVVAMAQSLRGLGALVAGIDIRTLTRNMEVSGSSCAYPAGSLEELSRAAELRMKLPAYRPPILVGYSSGATLAYGVLAQAPPETFAGAISLGFCPDVEMGQPLCPGRGLVSRKRVRGPGYDLQPAPALGVPWIVLHGDVDQVCSPAAAREFVAQVGGARLMALSKVGHGFSVMAHWGPQFVEAYRALAAEPREPPRPTAPEVQDLPLVEEPASGGPVRDVLAVLLSGDGGWAGIDKGIAGALAGRGIPVVGWNSLRYYWTPRTPDGAGQDLARLLRHYMGAWGKRRVILLGYSFGADVLPFLVSRLPTELRSRVAGVGLLGLSPRAAFEFHVTGWLRGEEDPRYPTIPELARLQGLRVACLYGEDDHDSACRSLPAGEARAVALPGGHHFGGDYPRLAVTLMAALDEAEATP